MPCVHSGINQLRVRSLERESERFGARMIGSGTVFGPYRVIDKIGAGGMGDVYRALDTRLEREVALKLISDGFLVSEPHASPSPAGTPALPRPPLP
jgi:serine/threonine protein kinase